MGLFSYFGRKTTPEVGPISPIQNLWRQYPEDTIDPKNLKWILKEADQGWTTRYMELLDAASNDFKVASTLRTRKLSVAGAPHRFEPGDESERGKQIADETADWFGKIPNVRQFLMDLLDAHYRGFSCVRPEFEVIDGRQMVVAWESIESRFFVFENGITPLIMTEANQSGEPLPPEYLFHVVTDKPGPITRGGTGRSIVKLWLYKGYGLVDMMSYVERFGQPHVQVIVPKNYVEGSAELERAKSAARSLIADSIGLVPEGVTISILESMKQLSQIDQVYLAVLKWLDEGIAQAELGHTLTSGASSVGGMGHGGEAAAAGDVKQDLKDADATGLVCLLEGQLIWPRTIRQYGEGAPLPRLIIDVSEAEDEELVAKAQKMRAETMAILKAAGLDISKRQARQEFDLVEPDGDDDIMRAEEVATDDPAQNPVVE
jgi:phage gp29-like protein